MFVSGQADVALYDVYSAAAFCRDNEWRDQQELRSRGSRPDVMSRRCASALYGHMNAEEKRRCQSTTRNDVV